MKNIVFLMSILLMTTLTSCSSDEIEDSVSTETSALDHGRSEEVFKQAVDQEVQRTLERAGQGNLVDLTKELMQKEEEIRSMKLKVQKKEEELMASIKDFESRVSDFRQQQQRFIGCIDDKDQEIDRRVGHMVNVISGMRPQNAAEVLSVQDADLAVLILERLNPDNVARIFNQMDKEISARLQKQYLNMAK